MDITNQVKDLQDRASLTVTTISQEQPPSSTVALKLFPKFTAADFETWRKKKARAEPAKGIASRIARNMPAWERGGSRLPAFREIMSQDLAELRAALAQAGAS